MLIKIILAAQNDMAFLLDYQIVYRLTSQLIHKCMMCKEKSRSQHGYVLQKTQWMLQKNLYLRFSVMCLCQNQRLQAKPREQEQPPCTLTFNSLLLCYSQPVEALPGLQKESKPPTGCLYILQEEASEEATPGNVNVCVSLSLEQTVNLVLTPGKWAQRKQERPMWKTIMTLFTLRWLSRSDVKGMWSEVSLIRKRSIPRT